MCEPFTIMAGIGLGVSTIGGITSAVGQARQLQSQAAASDYQAAQARQNAVLSGIESRDALQRGAVEEERVRQTVERIKGDQRAALAAGGFTIGDGSAVTVIADTAMLGELDALTARKNAEREAYGLDVQRSQYAKQSELHAMEAAGLRKASKTALATGILGTAADVGLGALSAFGGGGGASEGGLGFKARRVGRKRFAHDLSQPGGLNALTGSFG